MAIFHLSASIISRKVGRSATAAAAYRSAERIIDERTGAIHDYEKKSGVKHSEIIVPGGMEAPTRTELWNAVEHKNKRADAQVAREITLALPHELNHEQRRELAQNFAITLANKYCLGVDLAIHAPGREGDMRNHHAHILMTTNRYEGMQNGEIILGNKVRQLDMIAFAKTERDKPNEIENIREEWAHSCNKALERAGYSERIDHRSLKEQNIDREPTIHQGPAATAMDRDGAESWLVEYNKQIIIIHSAQKELAEINKILSEIKEKEVVQQEKAAEPATRYISFDDMMKEREKEREHNKPQSNNEDREPIIVELDEKAKPSLDLAADKLTDNNLNLREMTTNERLEAYRKSIAEEIAKEAKQVDIQDTSIFKRISEARQASKPAEVQFKTLFDAREAFNRRMDRENYRWMHEEDIIKEAKEATNNSNSHDTQFIKYMQTRYSELESDYKHIIDNQELITEKEEERASLGILSITRKNELDKKLTLLRQEDRRLLDNYHKLKDSLEPYRQAVELCQKHYDAFMQSPEKEAYDEQQKKRKENLKDALAAKRNEKQDKSRARGR